MGKWDRDHISNNRMFFLSFLSSHIKLWRKFPMASDELLWIPCSIFNGVSLLHMQ